MNLLERSADQLLAVWKWFLSFRSHEWELRDYPIRFKEIRPEANSALRHKQHSRVIEHRFLAYVVNWSISGFGASREEASNDLQATFTARKQALADEGKPLPRPGAKVPIEFASQERIDAHAELTQDFIHRVLGLDWAFISDESSLWDFHDEENNDALTSKIHEIYGVSVVDIESARICEILERIAAEQLKANS